MVYDNIKRKCDEKNISTFVLEKELGFGYATIWNWKDKSPTVQNLQKVAKYFGCTIDDLVKEGS